LVFHLLFPSFFLGSLILEVELGSVQTNDLADPRRNWLPDEMKLKKIKLRKGEIWKRGGGKGWEEERVGRKKGTFKRKEGKVKGKEEWCWKGGKGKWNKGKKKKVKEGERMLERWKKEV
jgi:hypothetical protein